MFEIPDFTEARIASVTNRTEAHGDERVPAVSVSLEFEFENTRLDLIDPTLRHALYKPKPDAEPELPGVEQSTPVLRSNSIDRVKLITAHEGWTFKVDNTIDAEDALAFGSCKVDNFSVEPKQGGTIILRCRVGTSDVDADRLGYLGVKNGQFVWVSLLKPEKAVDAIDGTVAAFNRDHPGATDGQGDLLEDGEGEGQGTFDDDMASAQPAGAQRGENWPFPKPDADGSSDIERSAKQIKAAEREQAELEAGIQQSLEKAGVSPKGARRQGRRAAGVSLQ